MRGYQDSISSTGHQSNMLCMKQYSIYSTAMTKVNHRFWAHKWHPISRTRYEVPIFSSLVKSDVITGLDWLYLNIYFHKLYFVFYQFIMDFHQVFEVAHSLNPQFKCSIFITDKYRAGMLLEGRDSPHVVDALLNCHLQSEGFVSTSDDDHHLEKRRSGYDILWWS